MAVDVGTGASVAFGTGGWTLSIRSIGDVGEEAPAIDDTHLTTSTARTYRAGNLTDGGSVSLEVLHDSSNRPVVGNANETIVITFDDATTASFSGFVQSYKINVPLEEMITATCSLKTSGVVTWA